MPDISASTLAVLIFIFLVVYFLPTIIAKQRFHPNVIGVFILNLFLGWSLIGWVGALIWALLA